jgi:hypothetical protein
MRGRSGIEKRFSRLRQDETRGTLLRYHRSYAANRDTFVL